MSIVLKDRGVKNKMLSKHCSSASPVSSVPASVSDAGQQELESPNRDAHPRVTGAGEKTAEARREAHKHQLRERLVRTEREQLAVDVQLQCPEQQEADGERLGAAARGL